MAACTLDVGPRRVLVSEEGPPAAEFALFDPSDIELAPGDGGALREAGYRTTAAEAVRRLAVAGITLDFAHECAELVRGRIAETYARGPVVRRLAPLLGAAELFDGGIYDAGLRRYEGTWLDLPLLANDAGIASSTGVLHAAALATLLSEVAGDTAIVLTTIGHSESLRLGERTLRRHAVDNIGSVPRALRHFVAPATPTTAAGPAREELLTIVTARLESCGNAVAREHLTRLERGLGERKRPSHGPLSDPDMWEAERLLSLGEVAAGLRRIEVREANFGREPATIYLRARAALLEGRESPRAIAQRIGEMALSMSNFPEVELLAAQAWNAAGETRYALPFARDLVANPRVSADLRAAAEEILRGPRVAVDATPMGGHDFEATGGELQLATGPIAAPALGPSAAPPPVRSRSDRAPPPMKARATDRPPPAPVVRGSEPAHPRPPLEPDTPASPFARSVAPPQLVVHDSRTDLPLSRTPSAPPPARPRSLTPPEMPSQPPPPVQVKDVRRYLTPPERIASPLPPRSGQSYQAVKPNDATRRDSALPPSATPQTPRSPVAPPPAKRHSPQPAATTEPKRPASEPPVMGEPSARIVQPWPTSRRAPREERILPQEVELTPSRAPAQKYMRGASMPPALSEPPTAIPRAPVVPRVDIDEADLIETLSLPRGTSETGLDANATPRTPLEARLRFSMDARELARRYRREQGVELRLESRTVAIIQKYLAQRFAGRVVRTPEEAREAELHGALLSELIARLLGAEWADIAPTDFGYWAMVLPLRGGRAKRVWPFGRVLRYIAGGGEDDLVAFFRKLKELS
jgi:hypothetical protein